MKPAPRVLRVLLSENWAIDPGWLPMLAAIAQRNISAPELEAAREWVKRDHLAMAGGGAQKLAGAYRGFVVNGIGVLPITGPIFPRANLLTEMSGATSLAMLQNDHRIMLASKDVRAIMLLIDSPGDAVSGVADFASRVAIGNQRKPTRAYVAGAAASAGYWIASAASKVSIDRTATLGSIGVVAAVPEAARARRGRLYRRRGRFEQRAEQAARPTSGRGHRGDPQHTRRPREGVRERRRARPQGLRGEGAAGLRTR